MCRDVIIPVIHQAFIFVCFVKLSHKISKYVTFAEKDLQHAFVSKNWHVHVRTVSCSITKIWKMKSSMESSKISRVILKRACVISIP